MANKKTAKKKTAKKKKVHTVESILDELRTEMRKGLGTKKIEKDANDYWEDNHYEAVKAHLANGADWDKEKKEPLKVAKKMGQVAKALAGTGTVEFWVAEAAHVAVKQDPTCPGIGAGGFCDF